MTTTVSSILTGNTNAEFAYVLEIEGLNYLFTTTSDTTGIATAWAATSLSAATVVDVLQLPGTITREIDLFGHSISPVSQTFEFIDGTGQPNGQDSFSMATLFANKNVSATVTRASGNVDRNDNSFPVLSTAGFPGGGGTFHSGLELVNYGSTDPTNFLSCTRGGYGFVGKATWAHDVRTTNGVGPTLIGGVEAPDVWLGRGVTLVITAKNPATGAWITRANCIVDFVGFVSTGPRWSREGKWSLVAESIESKTKTVLLRDQFTATLSGFAFEAISFYVWENGASSAVLVGPITAATYTTESLISELNRVFGIATLAASLSYHYHFGFTNVPGAIRVQCSVYNPGAAGSKTTTITVARDVASGTRTPYVLYVLGMEVGPAGINGFNIPAIGAGGTVAAVGGSIPLSTYWDPSQIAEPVALSAPQGSFVTQPDDTIPANLIPLAAMGFVTIGDSQTRWGVTYNPSTHQLTYNGGGATFNPDGTQYAPTAGDAVIRQYGEVSDVPIRQVWMTTPARASSILLRILLSTGTNTYNDATYDTWPITMGCGIPSTVIDTASFLSIDTVTGSLAQHPFTVTQPTAARDYLESFLQTLGAFLVWRNGKLTLTAPTHPGAMPSAWTLDETNTGSEPFVEADDGTDLIRNELSLRYNRDDNTGDFNSTIAFHDVAAQAKVEKSPGIQYDAYFLYDTDGTKVAAWVRNVAEPTCKYFGLGIWRYKRSGSRSLIGLALGDIVTFSAQDAPNPQTGTIGISQMRAWVIGYTYDPTQREFTNITLLMPTGNVLEMSPAGLLDYSRGDKGWDSANKYLYLRDHEFSLTTDDKDITKFSRVGVSGDKIRIIDADPSNLAAPRYTDSHVVANDGVKLTIADALSYTPAAGERWYVIFQPYSSQSAAQQEGFASMGDPTSGEVDGSGDANPEWGSHALAGDGQTPDATDRYRRIPDQATVDGSPVSTSLLQDFARDLNALYANIAMQQPINEAFVADRTGSVGSSLWVQIYGPVRIRVPRGCTTLNLECYANLRTGAGTLGQAEINWVSSFLGFAGPTGNVTWDIDAVESTLTTTATTLTRLTGTLTVLPDANGDTWIAVVARNSSGTGAHIPAVRSVNGWWAQRSLS